MVVSYEYLEERKTLSADARKVYCACKGRYEALFLMCRTSEAGQEVLNEHSEFRNLTQEEVITTDVSEFLLIRKIDGFYLPSKCGRLTLHDKSRSRSRYV
jgi:hypothetical protein